MATRKNDLLEQEHKTPESLKAAVSDMTPLESGTDSEAEIRPVDDAGEGGMDLNELLGSMNDDMPGDDSPDPSENELPEEDDPRKPTNIPDHAAAPPDGAEEPALTEETPVKPKRASRKKKAEEMPPFKPEPPTAEDSVPGSTDSSSVLEIDDPMPADTPEPDEFTADVPGASPSPVMPSAPFRSNAPVLTIRSREDVTTNEERDDIIWHEIRNAYRTRRILTGKLGGIEQLDNRKTIAIVDYKGFRIIIPLKEMMIQLPRTNNEQEYNELMLRQNKILNNMLGADMDFIVKGIDSKTFSVVASRKEAMLRKRQLFYLDTDPSGAYRIYEGRIVQARVIAVAEKVIRVEVFGVETSIMARDLAWDWIGDAHERFSVGDEVLVRVQRVRRDSLEDIGIRVDIKSISQNTSLENLQKCRIQSKYVGKVTDVHKGVVYIRLSNGANAIAHSCYDYRTPGKKDEVSFAVTRLDAERGVAVGIITRIIRQNL